MTRIKWTLEKALEESKKYETLKEFRKQSSGCYIFCRKNRLLEIVLNNRNWKLIKRWDKQSVIELAKKFTYIIDFQKENTGAYTYILRNGLKSKVFSHMTLKTKPRNYWNEETVTIAAK